MGRLNKKPAWIKFKIPGGKEYTTLKKLIKENDLNTVCLEAKCPNIGECFNCGTATFLIMGDTCTRNCNYCAVTRGVPCDIDPQEPLKIARVVQKLQLKYAVITSVTRDDLPDGGAHHFVATIEKIRELSPQCGIEILIPDFKMSFDNSLDAIIKTQPDILNHNIEVVKNYFKDLRPLGDYNHSLRLLSIAAEHGLRTKSGLMIGFGESMDDIKQTLQDLYENGCRIITIGQYLQPGKNRCEVVKYYHPEEFEIIKRSASGIGFDHVFAGPHIRSSYHAEEIYNKR